MSKSSTASGVRELPVLDLADCCAPLRREPLDADASATLAEAFKALADPVRLQLLNLIATAETGEACACDLVEPVGRSQPTVSHHLRILREAGLVRGERRGTWIWYSIRSEALDRFSGIASELGPGSARPTGALASPTGPRRRLDVIQPEWRQW
jgi:ArsR family transcriptional regulator